MHLIKKVLVSVFIAYLIYILIFSFFIYIKDRSTKTEDIKIELKKALSKEKSGDRVALIEYPKDSLMLKMDLIENAKSSIDVAYYKLSNEKVAQVFLVSLLEAADRGVEVRILLDGVIQLGNLGKEVNNLLLALDSHPNIDLKLYEPLNLLLPISWNNRMHDKIIIADREFALIGGRNIEDRFYLKEEYQDNFVEDREVLIYNSKSEEDLANTSVIEDVKAYYNKLWNHEYTKPQYKNLSERKLIKAKEYTEKIRTSHSSFKKDLLENYLKDTKKIDWKEKTFKVDTIYFVTNPITRKNKDPRCLKTVLELNSQAEESIIIQSPYIVPSRRIRALFNQYDIDTKIMNLLTNSSASSPNIAAFSGYKYYKNMLVDKGMSIHEYQGPGSIHAKTAIFDRNISMIGTFNLDSRSSYLSTESIVIIKSQEFSEHLINEMSNNLYSKSLEVNSDYTYKEKEGLAPAKISKSKKIMLAILSKLTPLFETLL